MVWTHPDSSFGFPKVCWRNETGQIWWKLSLTSITTTFFFFFLYMLLQHGCCAACCNRPLQRDSVKVQQAFSTHLGPKSLSVTSVTQSPTSWRNPINTLTHFWIHNVPKMILVYYNLALSFVGLLIVLSVMILCTVVLDIAVPTEPWLA